MYSTETYKQPFWSENSGYMTGRDPLGIQNSSITVYGKLLPGMTNLTLRIRYYGFYCWLLLEYKNLPKDNTSKTLEHHYNFIRRAELAVAYISLASNSTQTSIVGSDYVNNHLGEINELGYYNIEKGADKFKDTKKGSVYWDYTSGALGQYYVGSLINLDLVELSNKFFIITEKGKKLAYAFEKSVDANVRSLFLKIVSLGKLTHENIIFLEQIAINNLGIDSEECTLYNQLLIESDGERFKTVDNKQSENRRNSIKLYLEYISTGNHKLSFPANQFILNPTNSTGFGWYYYYINEAIHYCIETLFWGMLVHLDGKNIPIHNYINEIVELILDEMTIAYGFHKNQTLLEILTSTDTKELIEEVNELENLTKSAQNAIEAMGFAVKLLLQIYLQIENKKEDIYGFENLNSLQYQKGRISEYIKSYVDDLLEFEFGSYLEKLVKIIINDHTATAFRKMGNGESNLLKFVIEDGIIGHIQTMQPKFTNPRTRTLHNFMIDLGYVSNANGITQKGQTFLNQISQS